MVLEGFQTAHAKYHPKNDNVPFKHVSGGNFSLPVIHSDNSILRFYFTLTKHEQLERVDHGHLFTRHSAGTNLIQKSKITTRIIEDVVSKNEETTG